jgi:hypothetical protein
MCWKGRFANIRRATFAIAALVVGVLGAGVLAGGVPAAAAASASGPGAPAGSVRDCTAFAYQAIRSHTVVTGRPPACQGLGRAQVNDAASIAIRLASGSGPKSQWRRQAGVAAPWVSALLTGPVPAAPGPDTAVSGVAPARDSGVAGLAGVSVFELRVAALAGWLATAASGGYVLIRWLRAGGRPRGQVKAAQPAGAAGAVPAAVIVGHVGFGLFGLLLWAGFMITGWTALAWTATGLLGPVAGAGMGILVIGLPSPARQRASAAPVRAGEPSGGAVPAGAERGGTATLIASAPASAAERPARPRVPVFVIAAHGLLAAVVLLLVITATIGAS